MKSGVALVGRNLSAQKPQRQVCQGVANPMNI
jgi:hypothetical protein